MPTNDHDLKHGAGHDSGPQDPDSPGYELTDVNVAGVAVFLSGLAGFLVIFFLFCFVMGKVINSALEKEDGPTTKWNKLSTFAGAEATGGKRQDLASNPDILQKQYQQVASTFPEPRLDTDDGNQATADLHAREDLLLDNYSVTPAEGGAIRIPISRAMELIVQRGLPVTAAKETASAPMYGDAAPVIQAPLTTGFARTGYELDVIETRAQKLSYGKAEGAAHAELTPATH
jgi:hypothetical protein